MPVTRVIEGVKIGITRAAEYIEEKSTPVLGVEDPVLHKIALVALSLIHI